MGGGSGAIRLLIAGDLSVCSVVSSGSARGCDLSTELGLPFFLCLVSTGPGAIRYDAGCGAVAVYSGDIKEGGG